MNRLVVPGNPWAAQPADSQLGNSASLSYAAGSDLETVHGATPVSSAVVLKLLLVGKFHQFPLDIETVIDFCKFVDFTFHLWPTIN